SDGLLGSPVSSGDQVIRANKSSSLRWRGDIKLADALVQVLEERAANRAVASLSTATSLAKALRVLAGDSVQSCGLTLAHRALSSTGARVRLSCESKYVLCLLTAWAGLLSSCSPTTPPPPEQLSDAGIHEDSGTPAEVDSGTAADAGELDAGVRC